MDIVDNVEQAPSPRERAGFFSKAFFWWLNPLLQKGYQKELQISDLYRVLKCDESKHLGERLEREWKKELVKEKGLNPKKENGTGRPSLLKAILRTFLPSYSALGLIIFFEECVLKILQPVFMAFLIRYFTPDSQMSKIHAYLYATGVVMCSAIFAFTHYRYYSEVVHHGMKARVALCALIYKKSLRLSQGALRQSTIGQMVNLLSNDVGRFDQVVLFLHFLWVGPLQTAIVAFLTWQSIGPMTIAGAGLLIAFVPFQGLIGAAFSRLRLATAKKTDQRIRVMNEIINGIKVIKMYAWEVPFQKLITETRKNEVSLIRTTACLRSCNLTFFFSSTQLIMLLILLPFVLMGNVLTAEKAFFTLSMYSACKLGMTLFFPRAISQAAEAVVSSKRIEKFLLLEEQSETASDVFNSNPFPTSQDDIGITLKDVSAKWNPEDTQDTLKGISFSVKNKELCAIIGPVGSGKGSILQSLLSEITSHSGRIDVNGIISYSSQEPWVFSGTVRQNILFGLPFDEKRYIEVIKVCGLEHDVDQWQDGDGTQVGEQGSSLSGGQKARVNLARTVYKEADIYLLDDPLSAVDTQVGRHLYDECIRGYLRGKIVVLVTHQLQYLRDADRILLMKEGAVEMSGTYQEIMESEVQFSDFMVDEEEDELKDVILDQDKKKGEGLLQVEIAETARDFRRISEICLRRNSHTPSMGGDSVISFTPSFGNDFEDEDLYDEHQRRHMSRFSEDLGQPQDDSGDVLSRKNISQRQTSISWNIYWTYFKAGGSCFTVLNMIFLNAMTHTMAMAGQLWLAYWTNCEELRLHSPAQYNASYEAASPFERPFFSTNMNLWVFAGITILMCLFGLLRTLHFFISCMSASTNLHNNMFNRITRAPARFFDVNPMGRVLNRFSKDVGNMDELMPIVILDVIVSFLLVFFTFLIIVFYKPIVIFPVIVLAIVSVYLRRFYLCSSRPIKRLEGIARSPIFSQLSSSLNGLTTIRAFKAEQLLVAEFDKQQDIHSSAWFSFLASTHWFGLWLDWGACVFLVFCVFSFLLIDNNSKSGDVGVVISTCVMLTNLLQWGMRQSAEMETLMTSVERVLEYGQIQSEANYQVTDSMPPSDWPKEGCITFSNVWMQYGEEDKFVLKGLDFETEAKEKIGIVGRTGAGKSSLITALFRLTEPMGNIHIDGIGIKTLGLQDVRKKISIIPQDPVLFTGTLRRNLDPFDEYEDVEVWSALQQVNLDGVVSAMRHGLNSMMSEGGTNLSVGQRQLVCLARAILGNNRILVLDEATANVDPETDKLIQETIRKRFKNCTILTIAHRLYTVMDSDRILVLSDGKVEEFDSPTLLLSRPHGLLSDLVRSSGPKMERELKAMARSCFLQRLRKTSLNLNSASSPRSNSFSTDVMTEIVVTPPAQSTLSCPDPESPASLNHGNIARMEDVIEEEDEDSAYSESIDM